MVSASGAQVQSEVLTSPSTIFRSYGVNRGRIDLMVVFSDKIWIMEFKCNQSPEAGLKQIHEKGYADRFKGLGKKLMLMGIGFDSRKRCVSGWNVEAQWMELGMIRTIGVVLKRYFLTFRSFWAYTSKGHK